jgi:hypothetical protein
MTCDAVSPCCTCLYCQHNICSLGEWLKHHAGSDMQVVSLHNTLHVPHFVLTSAECPLYPAAYYLGGGLLSIDWATAKQARLLPGLPTVASLCQ